MLSLEGSFNMRGYDANRLFQRLSIFQGAVFLELSLLTNSEKYLWISPEAKALSLSLDSHSLSEGKKMIHTSEKRGLIR